MQRIAEIRAADFAGGQNLPAGPKKPAGYEADFQPVKLSDSFEFFQA